MLKKQFPSFNHHFALFAQIPERVQPYSNPAKYQGSIARIDVQILNEAGGRASRARHRIRAALSRPRGEHVTLSPTRFNGLPRTPAETTWCFDLWVPSYLMEGCCVAWALDDYWVICAVVVGSVEVIIFAFVLWGYIITDIIINYYKQSQKATTKSTYFAGYSSLFFLFLCGLEIR